MLKIQRRRGVAVMKDSVKIINQIVQEGLERKIGHLSVKYDDNTIGPRVIIDDKKITNFTSCSYLGLERHPQLIQGVIDAVTNYGTQYSSSRTYASIELYQELEHLLSKLFKAQALVTATTTLGHQACLPALVSHKDLVLIDYQAHASLQQTARLLKAKHVHVKTIHHNDLSDLSEHIHSYKSQYRKIWYILDGVYSMYGDFAPLSKIVQLMKDEPQLHVYVDDAHGMTWTGDKGQGYALSQITQPSNMIIATSLNKAFACSGGVLLFKNEKWAAQVKNCGETLLFSGPIQPPMLGAAVECAKLHLSGQLKDIQETLQKKILTCNQLIQAFNLPIMTTNIGPIFFIACGQPTQALSLCQTMLQAGFYANPGVFPAVPFENGGLRFTLTANHTLEQINEFVHVLHQHHAAMVKHQKDVNGAFSSTVIQKSTSLPYPNMQDLDMNHPK